ncbi:MAG: hypothetical protein NZ895_04865 [Archaeoglobaceae archaeon]|nr:hypothetical protein [Archaeoglobaceae archaeon]MCX8152716.1 hypothetical protein [Archaeoglobaceae archaeon]MDW8013423.1 hypothetical protein [Archaeoglobaceae archaeon]
MKRKEIIIMLLKLRVLSGIAIKTIGYMVISSGIFLSLKSKDLALKVVVFGTLLVIAGWFLILRGLILSKKINKF